jgi:Ser/Thr protein kinase RdoA (MazF antagonist)
MWNEKLKQIDRDLIPKLAVDLWAGDLDSIQLISEGVNLVYRFEINKNGHYLRLTHSELRAIQALEAAVSFQNYLSEDGVSVCPLVKSMHKNFIEKISHQGAIFLAQVCLEVPGKPIDFNHPDLNLYKNWGMALGKFHQASLNYSPGIFKTIYASVDKSFEELKGYLNSESQEIKDLLESVITYFSKRPRTNLNFGLTHGDHREGNVIANANEINIIDFDLPSFNWFTEDVFRPFFQSWIDGDTKFEKILGAYLEGYFSVMPRESVDLESFHWHLKLKGLEIYLWMKNSWNLDSPAPGGGNARAWLDSIYKKITSQDPEDFKFRGLNV